MPSLLRHRDHAPAFDPALRAVLWVGIVGALVVAVVAFANRSSLATLVQSEASPSGIRAYEIRQANPKSEVTVDAIDRLTGTRAPILAVADLNVLATPGDLRVRWISDAGLRIDLARGVVTRYRGLAFETAPHPLVVKLVQR